MKALGPVLGLAAPLLLAGQLLTSCGSDGEDKACNAGDLHTCNCQGDPTPGTQTCKDDGSGYNDCSCNATAGTGGSGGGSGTGGSGGGAMSGTAGSTGMTTPAPFRRAVGAACNTNADCAGAPLICSSVTSSGMVGPGGPVNGYCTLPCTSTDDCQAVDDISICNNGGYCVAECLPGMSQAKCRDAQACFSIADDDSLGVCLPRCASDGECGPNRFCDLSLNGVCVDTAPPGGKVGDPCSVATEDTDCASGFCIQYRDGAGTGCGAFCTFGLLDGCGYDSVTGGVRQAFCIAPAFQTGDLGDVGICFPLCDVTSDCVQAAAGWVCEPFSNQDAAIQQLGRKGQCIPGALSTSGADAGLGVDAGN